MSNHCDEWNSLELLPQLAIEIESVNAFPKRIDNSERSGRLKLWFLNPWMDKKIVTPFMYCFFYSLLGVFLMFIYRLSHTVNHLLAYVHFE